jgi:predicted membrane protein DUF2306
MNNPAVAVSATHRGVSWRFVGLLGAVAFLAVTSWVVVALPYFRLDREHFGSFPDLFWPRRYQLLLHIVGGTLALLVGPLQLWLGETRRHLRWHRKLGKLYLCGVAAGALGAYYLALTTPAKPGWV